MDEKRYGVALKWDSTITHDIAAFSGNMSREEAEAWIRDIFPQAVVVVTQRVEGGPHQPIMETAVPAR
jgi:hypothetical protein